MPRTPGTDALLLPEDALLLPEGARLLHVGPHKTGTTAVQAALWAARDDLRAQGVHLAGRSRNPSNAVRAVTGQPSPYSDDTPPPMRHWKDLVREIQAAREPRLVVSSEFFAWATPDIVRRIADELDPARIQVVVTLRPLARLLPSSWQQNIQAGTVTGFDRWLESLFREQPGRRVPRFWTLHRHHELIARWAEVVGTDRVTAVIVDDRDHGFVLRAFERLLGLREGTLVSVRDLTNRSLTLPEAEAVRAFNAAFKTERLPRALHARVMRFGAAQSMKHRQPAPDEPRVELPAWVIERVAEAAREIVAGVEATGVRVVGDPALLLEVPAPRAPEDQPPAAAPAAPTRWPEISAAMGMGILAATGAARETSKAGRFEFAEPTELARVPTYQVAGVLALRARRAAVRRLSAIGRRLRRR